MRDFIFPVKSGEHLGILRFLFFSLIFYFFAYSNYFLAWQWVPEELWLNQGLTFFLNSVHQKIPWEYVFRFWQLALVCSAVGFFSRTNMILSFVLGFLLIAHAQSFGYLTRLFMPPLWGLFIMSMSSAGDHFSIDAWIRFRRNRISRILSSEKYGWPIQLMRILLCLVFFNAGLSKLIYGGWEWISGETLRNNLLRAWIWNQDISLLKNNFISQFCIDHSIVLNVGAFISVLLEIGAPLALLSSRVSRFLISALFIMQQIIKYTILVNFTSYLALYIFWLPPPLEMLNFLRSRLRRHPISFLGRSFRVIQ